MEQEEKELKTEAAADSAKSSLDQLKLENERLSVKLEKARSKWRLVRNTLVLSLAWVLIAFSLWIMSDVVDGLSSTRYVEKAKIIGRLEAVINNGGSLDNVKHIYENRERVIKPWYRPGYKFIEDYYTENVSLKSILKDLETNYFLLKSTIVKPDYLKKLRAIISENEQVNPFDRLDDNQKYHFDNVRVLLDTNYMRVQNEIGLISEELNNKNQLVGRYLNKSETSFTISIIALVITIVLSVYQLYQGTKSERRLKQTIKESGHLCHSPFAPRNRYMKKEDGVEKYYICSETDASNESLRDRGYKLIQRNVPKYQPKDEQ